MSELRSLLELLGEADTLSLVEKFGGTRILVPPEVRKKHPLRTELGDKIFVKMVRHYGTSQLLIPLARHWRIALYREQKKTHREIARKLGVGESMVWRVLRRQELERSQYKLPF